MVYAPSFPRCGSRPWICADALLTDTEVADGHGSGCEGTAGGTVARAAPADDPGQLRGAGPAGGAGDAQLRALPVGVVCPGVPAGAGQADRTAAAAVALAAGEEPGG